MAGQRGNPAARLVVLAASSRTGLALVDVLPRLVSPENETHVTVTRFERRNVAKFGTAVTCNDDQIAKLILQL